MAGDLLDRQLTAPATRERVRFMRAGPEHDAAIRRLLRENPMDGAIRLSFEREPNFFAGTGLAGAEETTILAFAGTRLLCMGRCLVRPAWIDGGVKRVGYLGELRLDRSALGRYEILRGGYAFFRTLQQEQPADFYFTSIAADNDRARRLLERGVRGFPFYRFLADFTTNVIPVPRTPRPTRAARFRLEPATLAHGPGMVALLNQQASRHQLAAEWTTERLLSLAQHGLTLDQFQLAFVGDRLIACAGIWDQRPFRQTVVRGYPPLLRRTRRALNVVARLFGKVELPSVGSALAHGFLSPCAIASGHEQAGPEFVDALRSVAARRGLRLLVLGSAAGDPRSAIVGRAFGGRVYRTRLYQVGWPDGPSGEISRAPRFFLPEVALL